MIAVLTHKDFANRALLEEILANWAELLEPDQLRGVIGLSTEVPEADHARLRKAKVNVLTQLSNGKVYAPMGGGCNTAGSNMRTVLEHDRWARMLRTIEDDVRSRLQSKKAQLPAGKHFGEPPTFQLTFDNDDPIVVEMHSKVGFRYKVDNHS